MKSLARLKRLPWLFPVLLLLVWVGLPLVPEETGFRFGMGYQILFTAIVLLSALLFWLLGKEQIPCPQSTAGVVGSLLGVVLLTVGLLATVGVVYPQFERPQPPGAAAEEAAERGEELFRSATPPCIQCHLINGRGGTRGPDLTQVASRAGQRVQNLSAEQYLLEKITAGSTYQFKVPEYAPMMAPFGQVLTEEQIEDLVAYLLSLE